MSDLISRQAAIDAIRKDMYADTDYLSSLICDGISDVLNGLPAADAVPRWIPCREKLPKYGRTVLITNAKGNVSYGRFRGVEFWKEDGDSCWTWKKNTIEHVLAWMPLPEPYKEEDDE